MRDARLEERISYRCSMIATRITRLLAPMWEKRYGLSVVNWRVLAVIGRHAPISAKEVATRTSTEAFHVSRALEALVDKGLVLRAVDRSDRRKVQLRLTASGKSVHRSMEASVNRLEEAVMAGLDMNERRAVEQALALLDGRVAQLAATEGAARAARRMNQGARKQSRMARRHHAPKQSS